MRINRRLAYVVYLLLVMFVGAAWAGSEVGSFSLTANTNHGVMLWESSNTVTPLALTNGQFPIGSTGADPVAATITDGTGISHAVGAGTLTITNVGVTSNVAGTGIGVSGATGAVTITNNGVTSCVAGTGISVSGATGAVTITNTGSGIGGSRTVTAKTGNYTVLSGDSFTVFTNTGAGGAVVFTLPTAAAGLSYTFYVDAAQTLQLTAGSSTTIRLGGSVSASAGNITNNVLGGSVTIVAISTTQWIAIGLTGSWTVT